MAAERGVFSLHWACTVLALLVCAQSCAAGRGAASPSAPVPPDLSARLEATLRSELSRLGKTLGGAGNAPADRAASTAGPPAGADNAVFDLTAVPLDADGPGGQPATAITLSWTEVCLGDYDQNGEVAIGDLTPLGQHFQAAVSYDPAEAHEGNARWPAGETADPASGGPPAANNWRRARIDGDGNGELNIADVTAIAQNWGERLDGYIIEHGVNRGNGGVEWDDAPLDLGSGIAPSVPRPAAGSASLPVEYSVDAALIEPQFSQYFRVRAYDGQSAASGELSNVAVYLPTDAGDTTPPIWDGSIGATALLPGDGELTVSFDSASDEQSPPVRYNVYWAASDPGDPEAPFDFDAAGRLSTAASPCRISGLTLDQYYRVAVRAVDSAPLPNEEHNAVLLGETATARDVYPPEWPARVGITELIYGRGKVYISWDSAADSHLDGAHTWESGPVLYRVYHGPGLSPDWQSAAVVELPGSGQTINWAEIEGIDTTKPHWFAVRARDSAAIPNEDGNTVTMASLGIELSVKVSPIKSNWLVVSPDRRHTGLLLNGKTDAENWTELYDFDGEGFQLRQRYSTGEYGARGAYLHDDGSLALASTQLVGGMFDGDEKLYVQSVAGEPGQVFDLHYGIHTRVDFTVDGRVWWISNKILAFPPYSHLQQYFLSNPFEQPVILADVTLADEQATVDSGRTFCSSDFSGSFTIFAQAHSHTYGFQYYELKKVGSAVVRTPVDEIDADGFSYEGLFGWGSSTIRVKVSSATDLDSAKLEQDGVIVDFSSGPQFQVASTTSQIDELSWDTDHFGMSWQTMTTGWIDDPEDNRELDYLEISHESYRVKIPFGEAYGDRGNLLPVTAYVGDSQYLGIIQPYYLEPDWKMYRLKLAAN